MRLRRDAQPRIRDWRVGKPSIGGTRMDVPPELEPFFEFTLINCFALCSSCGEEQTFESTAAPCSDEWYLDMAVAIQKARWVIPERQTAACPACTNLRRLKHVGPAAA
jgi:hypothetical protein